MNCLTSPNSLAVTGWSDGARSGAAGDRAGGVDGSASIGTVQCRPVRLILERLKDEYGTKLNPSKAADYLSGMQSDGMWRDIDYTDRSKAGWKPQQHLDRTRILASAYTRPKHPMFEAPPTKQAVGRALDAWITLRPTSDNWWQNTIGAQLALMPILVLMGETFRRTCARNY